LREEAAEVPAGWFFQNLSRKKEMVRWQHREREWKRVWSCRGE